MNYSSNNFEYEYLVFIVLCCCILSTNSRSSTIWRLSSDETKIIEGNSLGYIYKSTNESHQLVEDDLIFNIISSTVHFGESWIKGDERDVCTNCHNLQNTLIRSKWEKVWSWVKICLCLRILELTIPIRTIRKWPWAQKKKSP